MVYLEVFYGINLVKFFQKMNLNFLIQDFILGFYMEHTGQFLFKNKFIFK